VKKPPFRIGNQTSKEVPYSLPYEFALRHGFDAFEWFSDKGQPGWSEDDMDAAARRRLRQSAEYAGLLFSVHAPYWADPVTPEGAAAIRKSVAFGGDVGAGVVNLHLFPRHAPDRFAEGLAPLLDAAASAGVRLSLENTPECSPEDFNVAFTALAALPVAGRIGMCLDMGHANLHAGTRNDYLGFVDRLGPHVPIIHWHAHENWGDRDSHLTLFTGPSARDEAGIRGLVVRMLRRRFTGSVVLEQWPHPPERFLQARDRLRQLVASIVKAQVAG
jgi:sugar phosphate isomerase/epimerase